jgi:hypothetical protein
VRKSGKQIDAVYIMKSNGSIHRQCFNDKDTELLKKKMESIFFDTMP